METSSPALPSMLLTSIPCPSRCSKRWDDHGSASIQGTTRDLPFLPVPGWPAKRLFLPSGGKTTSPAGLLETSRSLDARTYRTVRQRDHSPCRASWNQPFPTISIMLCSRSILCHTPISAMRARNCVCGVPQPASPSLSPPSFPRVRSSQAACCWAPLL